MKQYQTILNKNRKRYKQNDGREFDQIKYPGKMQQKLGDDGQHIETVCIKPVI